MKKILLGIVTIIVLAVAFMFMPATLAVEKSKLIKGDEALIYESVSKFENFHQWSPWTKLDPEMSKTFDGPSGQVGAKYRWESPKDDVGTGRQEITSASKEKIEMDLYFEKPFESQAKVYFTFNSVEDGVEVAWGFNQDANRMMTFLGIEEMVGESYMEGLNNLQDFVNQKAKEMEDARAEAMKMIEMANDTIASDSTLVE